MSKHVGWANVYREKDHGDFCLGKIYADSDASKKAARDRDPDFEYTYIDTIMVEWDDEGSAETENTHWPWNQ